MSGNKSTVVDNRLKPQGCEDDCGECGYCRAGEDIAYALQWEIQEIKGLLEKERAEIPWWKREDDPFGDEWPLNLSDRWNDGLDDDGDIPF